MKYTILTITEDDYGCEEMSEDSEIMCMVKVRDENGVESWVRLADNYLRENNIDEGSEAELEIKNDIF